MDKFYKRINFVEILGSSYLNKVYKKKFIYTEKMI